MKNLKYVIPLALLSVAPLKSNIQDNINKLEQKTTNLEQKKDTRKSKEKENIIKTGKNANKEILKTNHKDTSIKWKEIDEGLNVAKYIPEKDPKVGEPEITIVKVDPEKYNLSLFTAKKEEKDAKTAKEWANKENLSLVVNAGMFQPDYKTNVGYMKVGDFYNNPNLNKYNTIAAFGAKEEGLPEFQIIDRECQNWDEMKEKYESYVQGIRMINCKGNNVWSHQEKRWSEISLGEGKKGNAYFISSRSPYTMHNLNDILIKSPIEIKNSMHLEGGPEASLYLKKHGKEVKEAGYYETGIFEEKFEGSYLLDIPNVIGSKEKN